MRCEFFELRQLGRLGVRAGKFFANDKFGADTGIFGDEPADNFSDRITGFGDAK